MTDFKLTPTTNLTPTMALRQAGETLYGDRWIEPLARVIHKPGSARTGISWRAIRYYMSGERTFPDWLLPELARILKSEASARQWRLMTMAMDCEDTQKLIYG